MPYLYHLTLVNVGNDEEFNEDESSEPTRNINAGKQMKIKKQHQHFLYEFFALSRFNKSFEYADELTMLSS